MGNIRSEPCQGRRRYRVWEPKRGWISFVNVAAASVESEQAPLTQINVGICQGAVATMHTNEAAGALSALTGIPNELVTISVGRAGHALGGTNPVPAMRAALQDGRIDVAVHCLDEVPFDHSGTGLFFITPRRGSIKEALCTPTGLDMSNLPRGSRISADTPLRLATLRSFRPDLDVVGTFGTLSQRLNQLTDPEAELDAAIVSYADLITIRRTELVTEVLPPDALPPVAGQGAVAIEARDDVLEANPKLAAAFHRINHRPTWVSIRAERALMHRLLDNGCTAPTGVWGRVVNNELWLGACVMPPRGGLQLRHRSHLTLPSDGDLRKVPLDELEALAEELGYRVADRLLAQGAAELSKRPGAGLGAVAS